MEGRRCCRPDEARGRVERRVGMVSPQPIATSCHQRRALMVFDAPFIAFFRPLSQRRFEGEVPRVRWPVAGDVKRACRWRQIIKVARHGREIIKVVAGLGVALGHGAPRRKEPRTPWIKATGTIVGVNKLCRRAKCAQIK